MATPKEIRNKIASVKKIQQITRAMQNVAASKMRKAKQHMLASMPYAVKISEVVKHIAESDNEYDNPYLREHKQLKKVGYIVVSTDRGLCGGLNLNLFKQVLEHAHQFQQQDVAIEWCLFGKKAESFFHGMMVNVVASVVDLGELPKISDLLGAIKVMLDGYKLEQLDQLFIAHNEFISTITQKPVITRLLPLIDENGANNRGRSNYIYEPKSADLLDTVITRYLEMQVYQSVVDNVACEQVARMVAMQNATDNSQEIIDDLQVAYNKSRQTTITNDLAEIVGGAEAV